MTDTQSLFSLVGYNKNNTRDPHDFYATPEWATQKLLDHEKFTGSILEPFCGQGHICRVLQRNDYGYVAKDLINRGFDEFTEEKNFFDETEQFDNIISNPPYTNAVKYVRHALNLSRNKTAMIMRLAFLEGVERRKLFDKCPPARVLVFTKRVTMWKAGIEPSGSGAMAFAWFVWDRDYTGPTTVDWL